MTAGNLPRVKTHGYQKGMSVKTDRVGFYVKVICLKYIG